MSRRIREVLILLAIVAGLLAVRFLRSANERELEVVTVQPRRVQPLVLASGQLVYQREVPLSSELVARVARVAVHEGEQVHAGQALLQLDSNTFAAQVEQYEAQARQAQIRIRSAELEVANDERDFARIQRLVPSNFIAPNTRDEAAHKLDAARIEKQSSQEGLRQAQALLAIARESLAKTEIRAPIDGTVVAVPIRVGETAVPSASGIPGSVLMTIADTSAMLADVLVDEAEVSFVSTGQEAKVFPAGREDLVLQGTVKEIALMPKAGSHNYLVRVALAAPTSQLRTGMSCRVELLSRNRDLELAVPVQAIQSVAADKADAGTKSVTQVWVLNDGRAARRAITLGASDDVYQEVTDGLRPGEQVLVAPIRALHELSDGENVRTLPWREGSES